MTFRKGRKKTGGRKAGQSVNKIPKLVKDCVLIAAELEGMNQNGKDGMVGFLRRVAREDITAFVSLLGRVIPLQANNERDVQVDVVYKTVEEVRRELASRGIDMEVMARILTPPKTIEHEETPHA